MKKTTFETRRAGGRIAALLAALSLLALLLPGLGGCAPGDWEGEWNRTGDATYSRAVLTISNAGGGGFDFSMVLYNGNVAGELNDMQAKYTDSSKTAARCSIPNSRVYIDFKLNENGSLDVEYGNDLYSEQSLGVIESEQFGFAASAFISGRFVRGKTEYLNATLYDAGVFSPDEDARVRAVMTESGYARLLDCFQTWELIDDDYKDKDKNEISNPTKHSDEIGGYVYYGSNTMQKYAAIIILYDDGTVSVVVSLTDGSLVYFSDNAIYLDGSITPMPITGWMKLYDAEQTKLHG